MTSKKVFTLRIDDNILAKIQKIADINKRSTAMQIEYALELFIRDYERINGEVRSSQ